MAVIATMPPAAPAREWIAESLGIVESCNGDEDGGHHFDPSLIQPGMWGHVTCDIANVRSKGAARNLRNGVVRGITMVVVL